MWQVGIHNQKQDGRLMPNMAPLRRLRSRPMLTTSTSHRHHRPINNNHSLPDRLVNSKLDRVSHLISVVERPRPPRGQHLLQQQPTRLQSQGYLGAPVRWAHQHHVLTLEQRQRLHLDPRVGQELERPPPPHAQQPPTRLQQQGSRAALVPRVRRHHPRSLELHQSQQQRQAPPSSSASRTSNIAKARPWQMPQRRRSWTCCGNS